jgi:hypothetical protein
MVSTPSSKASRVTEELEASIMETKNAKGTSKTCRIFAIVVVAIAAGCTHQKDLSPPSLNELPRDLLQLSVIAESTSHYGVKVVAQYGNMSGDCGYVDYGKALGGAMVVPKADVPISEVDGQFPIYRDRYVDRQPCPWKLLGVGIDVVAPNGWIAFSGVSSRDLEIRAQKTVICNFSSPDVNPCLRATLYPNTPGVRVNISVR